MDDIKLFARNEKKKKKKLETKIQKIKLCSQVIGMKIGMEKFSMLIIKSGEREITEGL